MDRALALRAAFLKAETVTFDAQITADYQDRLYTFGMECATDAEGSVTFSVSEPEGIAGVTGTVSAGTGQLTFDGMALDFGLLAQGRISPISGSWIVMQCIRSGYIESFCEEKGLFTISVRDCFEEDALCTEICFDSDDTLCSAEISYGGRRMLSVVFSNVRFA